MIGSADVRPAGAGFHAVDPATGAEPEPAYGEAGPVEVAQAAALAAAAFPGYRRTTAEQRAAFLDSIAANIEALGAVLTGRVTAETGLPAGRITGETARTVGQLRLFATVVRDGGWRGVRVDTPLPDRSPLPRSDLRQRVRTGGTGRGLRVQQLPAGVLGPRRRHRLRAGGRIAGHPEGAQLAPGDVGVVLRAAAAGGPRGRGTGGHRRHRLRTAGGLRPGRAPRASRRSVSPARWAAGGA